MSRELEALGFAELSARRRHHARNEEQIAAFKKRSPPAWRRSASALSPGTEIEPWLADEARVGQKNTITRRWARRGTPPAAPHDQRTKSASIFGAICPKAGKGARRGHPRSGGLAPVERPRRPRQHHLDGSAASRARAEPCRKRLTLSKTSGSTSARTGSRIGSSTAMTISSRSAATPGTALSTDLGAS